MSAIKEKYLNNKSYREPIDPTPVLSEAEVEAQYAQYEELALNEAEERRHGPSDELMQADYEEAEYLADCMEDR